MSDSSRIINKLLSISELVVKRAKFGSVIAGPLVALVVGLPACLIFAYLMQSIWYLALTAMIIAALLVGGFLFVLIYFAIKHPEMLRVEEHEENMARITAGTGESGREIPEEVIEAMPATEDPAGSSDDTLRLGDGDA